MSSRRVISLVILFISAGCWLGAISCCNRTLGHRTHREISESAKVLASASNAFTLDLYRELVKDNSANLAMSGLSVHAALTMTYLGAKGETADEMRKVLHLDSLRGNEAQTYENLLQALKDGVSRRTHEFTLANALWTDKRYPVRKAFQSLIEQRFHGATGEVSFQDPVHCETARQGINDWTNDETKGMIPELLKQGDLNSETMLVLSNAMHFHGKWALPFLKSETNDGVFTTLDTIRTNVRMMHLKNKDDSPSVEYFKTRMKARQKGRSPKPVQKTLYPLRGLQNDSLQVLELPYRGEQASMLILLPREWNGLPELEQNLNATVLDSLISHLDSLQTFDLTVPKLRLEEEKQLIPVLKALGIHHAFKDADFSGMFERDGGFIGKVIHGASIEVDEQGTKAAAATHNSMVVGMLHYEFRFFADHPFLFLIRDNATGAILFAGRVTNPSLN